MKFSTKCNDIELYWREREKFIEIEKKLILGSNINLTEKEEKVNQILMCYKQKEFDDGLKNPDNFLARQHFFKVKAGIEKSEIFKIIKKLPKGASLHCHDLALTSEEYLLELTYKPNLYSRITDGVMLLKFFCEGDIGPDWKLVSDLRTSDSNFNECLLSHLTLIVKDPHNSYPTINSVWTAFMHRFMTIQDMITYKPIWEEYFYQALKELYDDNVKYLEFRTILPFVYDLQGQTYRELEVVDLYYNTMKKFKCDYPDFLGCRLIYAPLRMVDKATVDKYVENIISMSRLYPDFIAGIDLVGQEDLGELI